MRNEINLPDSLCSGTGVSGAAAASAVAIALFGGRDFSFLLFLFFSFSFGMCPRVITLKGQANRQAGRLVYLHFFSAAAGGKFSGDS